MKKEEQELIKRLFLKDPSAVRELGEDTLFFLWRDIHFHSRIGLIPHEQEEPFYESTLQDFVAFVTKTDNVPTDFSIPQLLHLLVVDRAVREHLMRRQEVSDTYWTYDDSFMPPSFRGGRLGMLRVSLGESEIGQRLVVDSAERMTPWFLSEVLIPYVGAISEIQQICNRVLRHPLIEVTLKSVSQSSPMDIKLLDAAEAINALKEDLIPWRRKHAQNLSELRETEVTADIRKKQAEALEIQARSLRNSAEVERTRAEAAKINEEAEQLKLENEKRRFELQRMKLELALDVISKMQPDLPQAERYLYAIQLLPSIDKVVTSQIEPVVIE